MSNKQTEQASDALIAWFESQDITPADALMIMANVIAAEIVSSTESQGQMEENYASFMIILREMVRNKVDE